MITSATTTVYVRVDLKSNRVIGVTDAVIASRPGQPVFQVAANYSNLNYYLIVSSPGSTYGITVVPATAAQVTAIDAATAAQVAASIADAKAAKALQIRSFYDSMFIDRFVTAAFMDDEDITCASAYTGTDVNMVTVVQPLAKSVLNALNEWRFNVCQPVIVAMMAASDMGVALDAAYTATTQTALDTFLTAHGFPIATYHR